MSESTRGLDVAAAFAGLFETLARDLDVESYLTILCGHCVGLVGATCAAIVFAEAPATSAARLAWSDELGRRLADHSLSAATGPWQECLTTGQLIIVVDLTSGGRRWPEFTTTALEAGLRSVTAIPVRSRFDVVGALALLGTSVPDATGIQLACALADAAGAGMLLSDELRRQERSISQLQAALTSRIVIEQAKGILAERWKVAPDEAFHRLRKYARANQFRLHDLALAIIQGAPTPPGSDG
jgi:hypothetical protein